MMDALKKKILWAVMVWTLLSFVFVSAGCTRKVSFASVVNEFDSRHVRVGMSTLALKEIFGERLEFSGNDDAFVVLEQIQEGDGQTRQPWTAYFKMKNGTVVNYYITNASRK